MTKLCSLIAIFLICCSCEKDETPIAAVPRGNIVEGSVSLGSGYPTQVYFNLNSQQITGQHQITDWDLGFECTAAGWRIVLNDARLMTAWASEYREISDAIDSTGFGNGKKIEISSESNSHPAIGDWRQEKPVYLIDLGYNTLGEQLGLVWIQFNASAASNYTLTYKYWGDTETHSFEAQKQAGYNFAYYSLQSDEPVLIPTDVDWHIKFTKYAHQFTNPPIAYLVTGVLLNPNGTAAVEIAERPFQEITAADTASVEWSVQPNAIGYDWKYYNFDSGTYEVDADRAWIIRTSDGFYYKFRFTDFYDENGQVGTPQFELALI